MNNAKNVHTCPYLSHEFPQIDMHHYYLLRFSGALNEGNKSGSVFNFIQQKLGGPSISDYEKLQAEKSDLQLKYDELLAHHRETCRRVKFYTL